MDRQDFTTLTAQKIKFSIKDFFNKCDQTAFKKHLFEVKVKVIHFCIYSVNQ